MEIKTKKEILNLIEPFNSYSEDTNESINSNKINEVIDKIIDLDIYNELKINEIIIDKGELNRCLDNLSLEEQASCFYDCLIFDRRLYDKKDLEKPNPFILGYYGVICEYSKYYYIKTKNNRTYYLSMWEENTLNGNKKQYIPHYHQLIKTIYERLEN